MSDERFRINDDSPLSTSVPEAPVPLARSVLERFRYGARKAAAQVSSSPEGVAKETLHFNAPFGSTFSQTTSHQAGLKIRALDINQFRTHVVLAGGKLLKTVRVGQEPSCTEDFNLHTVAINYAGLSTSQNAISSGKSKARAQDSNSVQRDMFDIEDVAWSNNEFRDHIATAARNGKIMLYDMNRPGVEVGSLHEHYRQVHKVDFNPLEGACLLSGSQDGTVRLWDLRSYRKSAMLAASMNTYAGRAEGVRHVKWSPRDTWSFAFGTDNGVIQRWDTRHHRKPVLKFSAHHETCNSIDWHPDGKHLISGGKDRIVKVWDISPEAVGRASFHVRTPREVQNVRWRPPCFITEPSEYQTIKQCTNFATSYRNYPVVQVWDLRRPHMPFREIFHRSNSGTTDMLWRSRDLLWTVGAEGEFNQTDVPFVPKTVDRRPLSSVSCGPGGQVSFVSQRRAYQRWPKSGYTKDRVIEKSPLKGDRLPFGRSPGDDSFDERFLGPTSRKSHSRAASIKSTKSLGATPPSTDEMTRMITTDLKTTMNSYDSYKPGQSARSGILPGTPQPEMFVYMHQSYKVARNPKDFDLNYIENIESVFEQNANAAQKASSFRDAQMWRILGHQISKELAYRREVNRTVRAKRKVNATSYRKDTDSHRKGKTDPNTVFEGAKPIIGHKASAVLVGNSSNTPTPVISAMKKHSNRTDVSQPVLEDMELPTAMESRPRLDSIAMSSDPGSEKGRFSPEGSEEKVYSSSQEDQNTTLPSSQSLSHAPDSSDVNPERAQSIEVPGRRPRRASSESFWMFSTSSDSAGHQFAEDSFPSNSSQLKTRGVSNDSRDEFEFNSSFQSNVSGSRNYSHYESRRRTAPAIPGDHDSFFDLPTHGNLHLDEFVGVDKENDRIARSELNERQAVAVNYGDSNSSFESPPLTRPQYRLAGQDEPLVTWNKPTATFPKTLPRQRHNTVPSVMRGAATSTPSKEWEKGHYPEDGLDQSSEDEETMLSDYVPSDEVQQATERSGPAITSKEMISELLQWYAGKGDALTAAHIFLLAVPLQGDLRAWTSGFIQDSNISHLNESIPSSELLTNAHAISIVKAQHSSLKSIGISPDFAECLLATYHEQLMSIDLMESAAAFRKLTYPSFPTVYEQGLKDVQIHLICLGCSHPINNPTNKMYCESCLQRQEDCAICWCARSPFEWEVDVPLRTKLARNVATSITRRRDSAPKGISREPANLWATCMICNHSIHIACADQWFADTASQNHGSGGACPVPGCLCDCVRGWYRDDRLARIEARERQRRLTTSSIGVSGGVKKDKWIVNESRAVGKVRGALRDPRQANSTVLEPSSGSAERQRAFPAGHLAEQGRALSDEGKRVRLVAPHESGS